MSRKVLIPGATGDTGRASVREASPSASETRSCGRTWRAPTTLYGLAHQAPTNSTPSDNAGLGPARAAQGNAIDV